MKNRELREVFHTHEAQKSEYAEKANCAPQSVLKSSRSLPGKIEARKTVLPQYASHNLLSRDF